MHSLGWDFRAAVAHVARAYPATALSDDALAALCDFDLCRSRAAAAALRG